MVPFACYSMPIVYSSIKNESMAVRRYGGIFDVSHMGKLIIKGKNFLEFADAIFPMNIKKAEDYKALYGYLLNEKGGVVDDLILYKFPSRILLIVNASNTDKVYRILKKLEDNGVEVENRSDEFSIIAVQGPAVTSSLSNIFNSSITIKRYYFTEFATKKYSFILARTGYTGEDGYEIIVENLYAETVWNDILEGDKNLIPCGLGARDVLRLEAGYPLYGHELSENITPLEVGGEKFICFDKNFIGKEALQKKKNEIDKILAGFELNTKHIARQHDRIMINNNAIGYITSGTYSFNFGRSIALGFIGRKYITQKNVSSVSIQHTQASSSAKIVDTFFLKYYKNIN